MKNIIATHLHTDHTGSLAEINRETEAKVYMHPVDAELIREGISFRDDYEVSPGLVNKLLHRFFVKHTPRRVDPVETDHLINNGDVISIGAGFNVIHIPGHSKGQVALLYRDHGGLLFSADSSGNILSLNLAPIYEDLEQGKEDLELLCSLEFDSATFGHGNPIIGRAGDRFRKKFL